MNPDDLANIQPAWKSLPSIPTRIPGEGASVNFKSCAFQDGAKVDSSLPEKETPPSSNKLKFYVYLNNKIGTCLISGGAFTPLPE